MPSNWQFTSSSRKIWCFICVHVGRCMEKCWHTCTGACKFYFLIRPLMPFCHQKHFCIMQIVGLIALTETYNFVTKRPLNFGSGWGYSSSSSIYIGNGSSHGVQTRWVGGAWSNLDFLSNFWQVIIIGVHCTSFFEFFRRVRLHADQTWWMGGAWADFVFWSNFWRILMIGVPCTSFFDFFFLTGSFWMTPSVNQVAHWIQPHFSLGSGFSSPYSFKLIIKSFELTGLKLLFYYFIYAINVIMAGRKKYHEKWAYHDN